MAGRVSVSFLVGDGCGGAGKKGELGERVSNWKRPKETDSFYADKLKQGLKRYRAILTLSHLNSVVEIPQTHI